MENICKTAEADTRELTVGKAETARDEEEPRYRTSLPPRIQEAARRCYHRLTILIMLFAIVVRPASSVVTTRQYRILEELSPPVFLGDISTGSSSAESNPRYSILPSPRLPSSLFYLNETSGALWANATFDRESVCLPRSLECSLQFQATTNTFQIFQVTVTIVDVNDNSPKFTRSSTSVSIAEDARSELTRFPLPSADDPDSGALGLQRYVLVPETETFALANDTGSGGNSELFLVLMNSLDREAFPSYELKVIAYDGGSPPRTGQLEVSITVIDVNDHAPSFQQDKYNVTISRNIPPGVAITRVQAVDSDSDLNGEIVYSMSPLTQFVYGDLFAVGNTSGDLYLTRTIDLLNVNEYSAVIQADDRGLEPRKNTTTVMIYVRDLQNRAPSINIITQTSSGIAEVMENRQLDTPIAFISITDPDTNRNGQTNCQVLPTTDGAVSFRLNPITPTSYTVVTMTSIDRELRDLYHVTIHCQDSGTPPLSSESNLTVVVLDQNDNSPRFGREFYDVTIDENLGAGARLLEVSAVDSDAGANANVSYSLLNWTGLLTIGKYSGEIKAAVNLEYSRVKQTEVMVLATDGGAPARNTTAVVSLTIRNINDYFPVFASPVFNFTVFRHQAIGSILGKVSATDLDYPPYNAFTYSLTDYNGVFSVNSETGEISTAKIISKFNVSSFQFVASAVDSWPPYFQAKVNVTVNVLYDADQAPRLLFPNDINNTIEVSTSAPIGLNITKIIAYNPDLNLTLEYGFVNESDRTNLFRIDHKDGIISVAKSLRNQEWNAPFAMEIQVTNNEEPILAVTATLFIHIRNSEMIELVELQLYHKVLIIVLSLTFVIVFVLVSAILIVMKRNQSIGKRIRCCTKRDSLVKEDVVSTQTGNPQDSNAQRINNSDRYSTAPFSENKQILYNVQQQISGRGPAESYSRAPCLRVSVDPHLQGIVERGSDTSSGCSSAAASNIGSGEGPSGCEVGFEPYSLFQPRQSQPKCPASSTPIVNPIREVLQVSIPLVETTRPDKDLTLSIFSNVAPESREIEEDLNIPLRLVRLSPQEEEFVDLPTPGSRTLSSQMTLHHLHLRKDSEISNYSSGECSGSKAESVFMISDSTVDILPNITTQRQPVIPTEKPKDFNVRPQPSRVMGRSECSSVGWPSVFNKTRSKFAVSKNIVTEQHLNAVTVRDSVDLNSSEEGDSSTSGSLRVNMAETSGTIYNDRYTSINV